MVIHSLRSYRKDFFRRHICTEIIINIDQELRIIKYTRPSGVVVWVLFVCSGVSYN